MILTYSGACCGLSFMSLDTGKREKKIKCQSVAVKAIQRFKKYESVLVSFKATRATAASCKHHINILEPTNIYFS